MTGGIGSRRDFLKAGSTAAAGAVWASSNASPGAAAGSSFAGGDLLGRFVYDGDPPERKPVVVTADKEFCGKQNILEEHLVVDPGNRGLANVFIWLYLARDEALPAG